MATPAPPAHADDYPLPAFQFAVHFDGAQGDADAAFHEVGGFGPSFETETYREGGENRFVHDLPLAMKPGRLVLRRGIAASDSMLVKWCKEVLEGGLARRIKPKLVQVALLDVEGRPLRSWSFDGAWPIAWAVDGFRANRNEVALERVDLHYDASRREK